MSVLWDCSEHIFALACMHTMCQLVTKHLSSESEVPLCQLGAGGRALLVEFGVGVGSSFSVEESQDSRAFSQDPRRVLASDPAGQWGHGTETLQACAGHDVSACRLYRSQGLYSKIDRRTMDRRTMDPRPMDRWSMDRRSTDRRPMDPRSMDPLSMDPRSMDPQSTGRLRSQSSLSLGPSRMF